MNIGEKITIQVEKAGVSIDATIELIEILTEGYRKYIVNVDGQIIDIQLNFEDIEKDKNEIKTIIDAYINPEIIVVD